MRYLYALVALGVLLAVHEFGHLVFAKVFRIRVHRFALGFGPPILTFKRRGIAWVLGAVPLGGSVEIHGANPHAHGDLLTDPKSFASRPAWIRILVLASGSILNYLLAVGIMVALFVSGTHVAVGNTIGTVDPGSVAARAQLLPGDVVQELNGAPLERWSDLVAAIAENPGQSLSLTVRRDKETFGVNVVPRPDEKGVGRLGISQQYVYRQHRFREALELSFGYTFRMVGEGGRLMWRIVRGSPGVDLDSPVGVVKQASDTAAMGLDAFLRVLVSLSVALAIFNLLPFPALDGGRMVFAAFEGLTKRRVNPRVETLLHTLGFLLLLSAVILIATRDFRG
jgi:regulator of sigma E protease